MAESREGRDSFEERLVDGYSDQEDSEIAFPEESCSSELTWISALTLLRSNSGTVCIIGEPPVLSMWPTFLT